MNYEINYPSYASVNYNTIHKPREEWDPYDPMFISEGMFGAANIFSFLKLVHIFSVHPHLGPLQISLGRMVFEYNQNFSSSTPGLFLPLGVE